MSARTDLPLPGKVVVDLYPAFMRQNTLDLGVDDGGADESGNTENRLEY